MSLIDSLKKAYTSSPKDLVEGVVKTAKKLKNELDREKILAQLADAATKSRLRLEEKRRLVKQLKGEGE